jgi:hypothetical protein
VSKRKDLNDPMLHYPMDGKAVPRIPDKWEKGWDNIKKDPTNVK